MGIFAAAIRYSGPSTKYKLDREVLNCVLTNNVVTKYEGCATQLFRWGPLTLGQINTASWLTTTLARLVSGPWL